MKNKIHLPRPLMRALSVLFWIAVWWLVALAVNAEVILPTPWRVLTRLVSLGVTARFWRVCLRSLLHVLAGFLIGALTGTLLAILAHASRPARILLEPLLGILKATPVASFVILALLFIRSGNLPILIVSIIVTPVVWSNMLSGLDSLDSRLQEVTILYAFSFKRKLRAFYLPELKSYIYPALTAALGLAWKSGISAEVIASSKDSIGNMLNNAKIYIETPDLFAWTVVIILFSRLFDQVLRVVWKGETKK